MGNRRGNSGHWPRKYFLLFKMLMHFHVVCLFDISKMNRDEKKTHLSRKNLMRNKIRQQNHHKVRKFLFFFVEIFSFSYITSTFHAEKNRWKNVWKLRDILLFSEKKIISMRVRRRKKFCVSHIRYFCIVINKIDLFK